MKGSPRVSMAVVIPVAVVAAGIAGFAWWRPALSEGGAKPQAAAFSGASHAAFAATAEGIPVTLAEVVQGMDLRDPAHRAAVVRRLRENDARRRAEAVAFATSAGWPLRVLRPDGGVIALGSLQAGRPRYRITRNINAAISTGARALQWAPESLTGGGVTIGLWDAGAVRATHQEFGGRVVNFDPVAPDGHATHIAGTLAASGVVAPATGMAPQARVDAYDWDDDLAEMAARGAAFPGEDHKLALSNHAYGYTAGWFDTGGLSPAWVWYGEDVSTAGTDPVFGVYGPESRDHDALAHSLPYYLIFRAAGNDRQDNPRAGDRVKLSPETSQTVTYQPDTHPPGDGVYLQGYDTLSYDEIAKNVISVGSVRDATSGSSRVPANGVISEFSSWGPTDDGRIKPDLVANGEDLYSTAAGRDDAYATEKGTSMATANATGSVALLVDLCHRWWPGEALRASTLKALLLHTADDLGRPGPDYQYGWGLLNVKAAADVLRAQHDHPTAPRLVEDRVTTARPEWEQSFTWNGSSPLRLTLGWTDPPGESTTESDARTPRLVNNLDLTLLTPDGTAHRPFVMPYVGDWSPAALTAGATPGKNDTDNVEQVFLATPTQPGTYTARVTVDGALTGDSQVFSLVITGGADTETPPAPTVTAVSPEGGSHGLVTLTLEGSGFRLGTVVTLTKDGEPSAAAFGHEVTGDALTCRVGVDGLAAGYWDVVVTNPEGASATLPAAFRVQGAVWGDGFETEREGWLATTAEGTEKTWAPGTTRRHSGRRAYTAAAPNARHLLELTSPPIPIPEGATDLHLRFWHAYHLPVARCGGVLEISFDDGASWVDAADEASGLAFAEGAYPAVLGGGHGTAVNPLAGRAGWAGTAREFTEVVLPVAAPEKFAGHTIRLRWRLGGGQVIGGEGMETGFWHLDDVAVTGQTPTHNLAPVITAPASAEPAVVTGTTAAVRVTATDDAGEAGLTYAWSAESEETLPPVSFGDNGGRTAHTTTATFFAPGDYTLHVTVRDDGGLSATSSVPVVVARTATRLEVVPPADFVSAGAGRQFAAQVVDQFGHVIEILDDEEEVKWAAEGGAITAQGWFTAGATIGDPFTITVTAAGLTGALSGHVAGVTLDEWKTACFGSPDAAGAGDLDDGDGDGLPNLLEYALGGDPQNSDPPPTVVYDGDALTMTFTRPPLLPDVVYRVEASADLHEWSEIPVTVTPSDERDYERVSARFAPPAENETSPVPHAFLRLRVGRAGE